MFSKGKPVNSYGLMIAAALGLSAFALSVWALLAVRLIAKALASGFEGIHFDK